MIRLFGLSVIICLLLIMSLFLGSSSLGANDFFEWVSAGFPNSTAGMVFLELRLPRAVASMLCGGSLGVAGLLMQTLFKNPLAGPGILGMHSTAGLAVAIVSLLPYAASSSIGIPLASILGALLGGFLLYLVHKRGMGGSALLIIGVMMTHLSSAVVSVLIYGGSSERVKSFLVWSMGSFEGMRLGEMFYLLTLVLVGLLLAWYLKNDLDQWLLGIEYAEVMGVDVKRTQWRVILSVSILSAGVLAYCGPVGFVGMTVPHIARALGVSRRHKLQIPMCFGAGALLCLGADLALRIWGPFPLNAMLAIVGVPVVCWVLYEKRGALL